MYMYMYIYTMFSFFGFRVALGYIYSHTESLSRHLQVSKFGILSEDPRPVIVV